jgi:hypothetical protein
MIFMVESQDGDGNSGIRHRIGANGAKPAMAGATQGVLVMVPCGDCKFLKRKCTSECIFEPYFGTNQDANNFAAVHKVFGASNVSKLLSNISTNHLKGMFEIEHRCNKNRKCCTVCKSFV